MLTSCASVRDVRPDGSYTEYNRLGNQEIGKLVIIDMTTGKQIQLEGQRAMNDKFVRQMTEGIVNGIIGFYRGGQ